MMRLGLLALAIAVAPAQDPPRSKGAAPPPELGATVQFAPGADLVGPWQAYSVELTSLATRDLDLLIRIEDIGFSSVALRREHLPVGARKRVFLYGPGSNYARGIEPKFRITDASDRQLQGGLVPITPRGYVSNRYQVGLFCRAAAAEDDFGLPSTLNGVEVRYARIAPDTLPDRWIGLAGLDLILIHDAPLDEITTDQARALADYVRQGGTILASPGATKGWLAHPVLGAIATIRAAEPTTVDAVPGLSKEYPPAVRKEPFLLHPLLNGEPFKPGLAGELVRFPCGFGRILVAGADLRRAPFDTWAGRRKLWRDVLTDAPRWYLEDRAAFPGAATARQRFEVFHQMARLINPYPSFLLILGLATLFLATVGPLNYILLWRLRRTILLVITVPAISIAFLGGILALGYVLKGTLTVTHSARLLHTRSGLGWAREIQLFSLFSPSTRTYDVAFDPSVSGQPPGRWVAGDDRYQARSETGTLTCETGAALTLRGLASGQWQSWDLEARSIVDLGKGVRFEFDGATVRVTNDSPRSIERGIFVQTGREPMVIPFGEVPRGGRAEGAVGPAAPDPFLALGFGPETLGDRVLRPWFSSIAWKSRLDAPAEPTRRFLLCVLPEERPPVQVDARVSDRSRALTLLHVAEAP